MSRLFSVGDAARVLGLSAERVRQLADTGRLPVAHRTGTGQRLFDPDAVEQFQLARHKAE